MVEGSSVIAELVALAFLGVFLCFMKWLEKRPRKQQQPPAGYPMAAVAKEPVMDHNPGRTAHRKAGTKNV